MKKIVLSLAGVLAATAFAPEAAAVPSFARQTGMACNACHFQSYPALTAFGRAFKGGGYTMMGAQEKIEGEHGLSIPNVLNASLYVQLRYNKTNGTAPTAAASAGSKNAGRFDFPDEMALFVGGRGSDNVGMLAELATNQGATTVANFKMPFVFETGGVKLSAIPFWTGGLSAAAAYDLFATGSNAAGRVTENGTGYSAAMYMGASNNADATAGSATGVALVAANDTFHVVVAPYAGNGTAGAPTPAAAATAKLGATYLRAGWTPSYNNWDLGIGLQNWSGKPFKGQVLNQEEVRLTIIDGQAQGEVNGMPLGVYASYGWAPASTTPYVRNTNVGTGANENLFNNGANRKSSFGVLADLWVVPGTLGVQFGLMRAKTGMNKGGVVGAGSESDNSYTIGARYKIRQNVKFGLAYTKFSGDAYGAIGSGGTNADDNENNIRTPIAGGAAARRGNQRFTAILSAGF